MISCHVRTCQGHQLLRHEERPNILEDRDPQITQLITWTDDHLARLRIVIDLLTQPDVMAYPDFKTRFVLHTDASHEGLGAVLYQEQGEKMRVVRYGSRTLTPAERNNHFDSGKLEFLALKWAFTDKFRD